MARNSGPTMDTPAPVPLDRGRFRPVPPPVLFDRLTDMGYRGQVAARRAMCLLAYRHLRRAERLLFKEARPGQLPPKTNALLMGPTGCGKTFLVELLFGRILPLPVVVIDITGFSETGYVGDSVKTILTRLLHASRHQPELAAHGVVCLDEFDKLAGSHSNIRFDGAGTTKDVTGYGVQKELLKMIEGCRLDVPLELAESIYTERAVIDTSEILFIGAGAFSGFKGTARFMAHPLTIGYLRDARPPDPIAYHLEEDEAENVAAFQRYGFLPEMIGRFGRIVALSALEKETLEQILMENLLPKYVEEFAAEGISLQVLPEVTGRIVEDALRTQIGARGLGSRLNRILETAAFEGFGRRTGELVVRLERGEPTLAWSGKLA